MKTIEQQKADLLDHIVNDIIENKDDHLIWIVSMYAELTAPKESTNPYIDEVFDMRICNVISDILNKEVKKIRLSDCPHINRLQNRKNIGIGSLQLYESTMQKYELNDKLI